MIEFLRKQNKTTKLAYLLLILTFFSSCFFMFPFCRASIINFFEFFLHKSLSFDFWNRNLFYLLITIASFALYWLISSWFSFYIQSDKFSIKTTKIIISICLFFISFIVQTVLLYNGIVYGGDDPAYITIAKAIAEKTYKIDFLHMQYTIGYPGLLAIAYKLFGMNYYALKFVNVILYSSFVVILFHFLDFLIHDVKISLYVSSIFCLNFTIANWQNRTMSDTTCMVFCLFCLVLIFSIYFSSSKYKYLKAFFLGLCFFIAYACRVNGIVCIITLLCMQILIYWTKCFSKTKILQDLTVSYYPVKLSLHILPYIVFGCFLILQKIFYPSLPRQDLGFLAGLSLNTAFQHFRFFYIMYEFFNSAWNEIFHQFNILSKIAFYTSLILALFGIIKNWKKLIVIIFFTIGTSIIYCIWGGFGGIRFYFPLFISLSVFCAYGAKSIKELNFSKFIANTLNFAGKFKVLFFCALFTVSVFPVYTKNFKNNIEKNGHSYSKEAQDVWAYINENIPSDNTILFRASRELWLYTKHQAVPLNQANYYLHSFEKTIDDEMKNFIPDEIVCDDIFSINERIFKLEYSNEKFRLFHIEE